MCRCCHHANPKIFFDLSLSPPKHRKLGNLCGCVWFKADVPSVPPQWVAMPCALCVKAFYSKTAPVEKPDGSVEITDIYGRKLTCIQSKQGFNNPPPPPSEAMEEPQHNVERAKEVMKAKGAWP